MAWTTIRKATDTDQQRLDAAAIRFCERHGITIGCSPVTSIDAHFYANGGDSRLERLWNQCAARALNEPGAEGIAYGHVGYHAE